MQNIQALSPQPGDIVRENETALDYVIYSVAGLGGGLLTLSALSIYDANVKEWISANYDEVELQVLKKNAKDLDATEIYDRTVRKIKQAELSQKVLNRGSYAEKLRGPEGAFVRSMLLIGDSVEEYDRALVDLAKALTGTSSKTWTTDEIFEVLVNAVPEEEFDIDFLKTFSGDFYDRLVQASSGRQKDIGSAKDLANLLLPASDDFNKTNLRLAQKYLIETPTSGISREGNQALFKLVNPNFKDDIVVRGLGGKLGAPKKVGRQNLGSLVNKMMIASGGRDAPELYQHFLTGELSKIVHAIRTGREPTQLMSNLFSKPEFQNLLSKVVSAQSKQLVQKKRTPRTSQSVPLDDYLSISQTKLSIEQVNKVIAKSRKSKGSEKFFSMHSTSFFENYLAGNQVKINDEVFDLSKSKDIARVKQHLRVGHKEAFYLSARDLKDILTSTNKRSTILLDKAVSTNERLRNIVANDPARTNLLPVNTHVFNRDAGVIPFSLKKVADHKQINEVIDSLSLLSFNDFGTKIAPIEDGKIRRFYAEQNSRIYAAEDLESLNAKLSPDDGQTIFKYIDLDPDVEYQSNKAYHMAEAKDLFTKVNSAKLSKLEDYVRLNVQPEIFDAPPIRVGSPMVGDIDMAYNYAYNSHRMAFIHYKNASGTGSLKPIATGVSNPTAIQDQLDRARYLFESLPEDVEKIMEDRVRGKIAFFDIETAIDTGHFTQISLIDVTDLAALQAKVETLQSEEKLTVKEAMYRATKDLPGNNNKIIKKGTSLKNRKNNLVHLINDLDSYQVIATQSTADYGFLLQEAQTLFQAKQLTQIEYETMVNKIDSIKVNKALTTEIIPMVSGHTELGRSSQNYQTQKYLKRTQLHTAIADNMDNFSLMNIYREGFSENARAIQIADITSNPFVVKINSNRFNGLKNQSIIVESLRPLTDGKYQVRYLNQEGVRATSEFEAAQIGALMRDGNPQPVSNQMNELGLKLLNSQSPSYQRQVKDTAQRMLNDFLPTGKNLGFPYTLGKGAQQLAYGTGNSYDTHAYRIQYLTSKFEERLDSLPLGDTFEQIQSNTHKYLQEADEFGRTNFFKLLEDNEFPTNMLSISDAISENEYQESLIDNISVEYSRRVRNASRKDAAKMIFSQEGAEYLGRKVMEEDSMGAKFQFAALGLLNHSDREIIKADTFRFSLDAKPFLENQNFTGKLRAGTGIENAYGVDLRSTFNAFTSELMIYGAHGEGAAGNAAREFLSIAGIGPEDLDSEDFKPLKNLAQEFFTRTTHSAEALPIFGVSPELTSSLHLYRKMTNKFYRAGIIPELVTNSLTNRAAQMADPVGQQKVLGLANIIKSDVLDIQNSSSQTLGEDIANKVTDRIREFLGQDESHTDLLKQDYETFNYMKAMSQQSTIEQVLQESQDVGYTLGPESMADVLNQPDIESQLAARAEVVERAKVIKQQTTNFGPPPPPNQVFISQKDMLEQQMNKARRAVFDDDNINNMAEVARRYTVPDNIKGVRGLMVLAGAVAMAGMFKPDLNEAYDGGDISKELHNNQIAKVSGIPGNASSSTVFVGQETPFKLRLNIQGFVGSKQDRDKMVEEVYNTMTSTLDFRRIKNTSNHEHKDSNYQNMRKWI